MRGVPIKEAPFNFAVAVEASGIELPESDPGDVFLADKDKSTTFDFSAYLAVAGNPTQLIDLIDQTMLHGTMSGELRDSLSSLSGGAPGSAQVRNAIALVAASPEFSVQK